MSQELTPDGWRQVSALLDLLLELPPIERPARLEEACGGDAALRQSVEELLRGEAGAEDYFAESVLTRARTLLTKDRTSAGGEAASGLPQAGPWRALRVLGRGGMGVVYLAERADGGFAQTAALKLLPLDLDTEDARARFLREREILARLQHAHIAHLLDGGVAADGRPYFAMEFVEGEPVPAWCDARCASLEQRLRLFLTVCDAVQHAHGRLIVHRDLKPDNILVDGRGQVKLLDFGIAKVLEEGGAATQTAARALTPSYAAPEQFLGAAVTVATDVYQLGLVLYELLSGHRAHGEQTDSPLAVQRRVLEADPERPSRVVRRVLSRQCGGEATTVSPAELGRRRGLGEAALRRRLDGDLDAIVLKALRREPERRYESVEALRRDIDDCLGERPVSARRGTRAYRLRKYVRRHRLAIAAAAAVSASLTAGLLGVISQGRVAAAERDRARLAEARATAVNDFLVRELLQSAAPEKALGRKLTVEDVLANASRSVGHAFPGQPETEAEVRLALAGSYAALGQAGLARPHAEAAERLLLSRHGQTGAEAMRARRLLSELALDEGRYAEARGQAEKLLSRQAALLGPRHPDVLATTATLGRALNALGQPAAAEAQLRGALAAVPAGQWRLAVELNVRLVDTLLGQYKVVEAEAVCRELLGVQREHLGDEHPEVARGLRLLTTALTKQLRYQDAHATARQLVELSTRLNGEDHPATADALVELAVIEDHGLFRYDEALAHLERAQAILRRTLGPEHPKTLRSLGQIGVIHGLAGRAAQAEPIYREVLEARRRTLGETHPDTILARRRLNILLFRGGRVSEARAEARRVAAAYETLVSANASESEVLQDYSEFLLTVDPPDVQDPRRALELAEGAVAATQRREHLCLRVLGMALERLGRIEEAIATLREALALPEAIRSWTTEDRFAALLRDHAQPQVLEAWLLERLERMRSLRGEREPLAGKTLRLLAQHYARHGRRPAAEQRYAEAIAQLRKTRPESDWEIGRAKSELGGLVAERGAYAEAEPLLLAGHDTLVADVRTGAATVADARQRLARLYQRWGRPADAERWRRSAPRRSDGAPGGAMRGIQHNDTGRPPRASR